MHNKRLAFCVWTLSLISAAITGLSFFLEKSFGLVSMSSIIFTLRTSHMSIENSMKLRFIAYLITSFVLILSALFIFVYHHSIKTLVGLRIRNRFYKFTIIPLDIKLSIIITISLFIVSLYNLDRCCALNNYIRMRLQTSKIYEKYYISPKITEITFPAKKRNLILIYLESMENTFLSKQRGGALDYNLIPELDELASKNYNFSQTSGIGGPINPYGTGWTIGAIFASTSGLPLCLPIEGNSYSGYGSFAPGAYTLGDILQQQKYNLTFLVGSDSTFAGRKDYMLYHGNYRVLDVNTAERDKIIPKGYRVWWGYEDKYLFKYAKNELKQLDGKGAPFMLSMLTVDTHHIGGYKCDLCQNKYEENLENVVACSSRQLGAFVQWIQKQKFYKNTTIVLIGDHLSMDPEYFNRFPETFERRVYNVFINPSLAPKKLKHREFTTFDLFPTILASIGVKIKGNRLAFGTNLFSGERTLVEKIGIDTLNKELSKYSSFYEDRILCIK